MSYEKRDGIVLFANDKRTSENQPVMRGVLTFDGTEYEVSVWGKTSKKGTKFWSGSFKRREIQPAPVRRGARPGRQLAVGPSFALS